MLLHAKTLTGSRSSVPSAFDAFYTDHALPGATLLARAPELLQRLDLRSPARHLQSLAELVAIQRGETDIEQLIEGQIGTDATHAEWVRARNRIYKAHTRVRENLVQTLLYCRRRGLLPETEATALLSFVQDVLHRRNRIRRADDACGRPLGSEQRAG